MNTRLLLLLFTSFPLFLCAQQPSKYSISLRGNAGLTFANIDHIQGTQLSQAPGVAIELGSAFNARLNDFWIVGLGLRTGLIAHSFSFGPSAYSASYVLYPRFEGHVTKRFHNQKNVHSDPYFRMSYGQTWFDGSTLENRTDLYQVDVSTLKKWIPHISPEIGLIKSEKNSQLQLGLTYTYSFSQNPILRFEFEEIQETNPNKSLGFSNLNYFGLIFRYNFGLKEFRNDGSKIPNGHGIEAAQRETRKRKEAFYFSQSRVVLELTDNAQVDGDSVSVRLNGKWVLYGTPIDNSKKRVVLYLKEGTNELLVFANNEGRVSPNTVKVRLISGFRRKSLTISTSLDRNEAVDLILK